jgi:hypothetical protein
LAHLSAANQPMKHTAALFVALLLVPPAKLDELD